MENKTQLHKPTITDIVVAIVWDFLQMTQNRKKVERL